jgi:hypothetical protein
MFTGRVPKAAVLGSADRSPEVISGISGAWYGGHFSGFLMVVVAPSFDELKCTRVSRRGDR